MKVVTAEQMRAMDKKAIEEFGIPGVVLMENAGRSVVEFMARKYGPLAGKRIAVFCGGGNNGGDGFVIARLLHLQGAGVRIILAGEPDALKGDAKIFFDLARNCGVEVAIPSNYKQLFSDAAESAPLFFNRNLSDESLIALMGYNSSLTADLIVDALLGTGVKEAPREPYARLISTINVAVKRTGCPVISVDIPSGVDADTGATPGEAVRATDTVTFAYPKLGLFLPPGLQHVGKLSVENIGFDWERLELESSYRLLLLPGSFLLPQGTASGQASSNDGVRSAAFLLQKRHLDANKGEYGHVAVIAGSRGMAGAPSLVARGAQRAGAGLVTVLTASSAQPTIAAKLDEQMTLPLPEEDGSLSEAAFDAIAEFAKKATVLCVGPGLTTKPGTVALVQRILAEIEKPLVLDADGLNALALNPDVIARRPKSPFAPLIITPHPGEAGRLLNRSIAAIQADRIGAVRELATKYQCVAVLKGGISLTADPDGNVIINTTGNPGMATGGSGDSLTGILGGLLAQGVAPGKDKTNDADAYRAVTAVPLDVTALAVYVHGVAGDIAAERVGPVGMTAGDIVDAVPHALLRVSGTRTSPSGGRTSSPTVLPDGK